MLHHCSTRTLTCVHSLIIHTHPHACKHRRVYNHAYTYTSSCMQTSTYVHSHIIHTHPHACKHSYIHAGSFLLSSNGVCDSSIAVKNIKRLLKLGESMDHIAFRNLAKYKDYLWMEEQLTYFSLFYVDKVIIVPPCFFQRLSSR